MAVRHCLFNTSSAISASISSRRMTLSLCYELISSAQSNKIDRERERERDKQTSLERSTQCTNKIDPIASTSELLPRQNSVTAHAHQS
jgi:hypothetical protein